LAAPPFGAASESNGVRRQMGESLSDPFRDRAGLLAPQLVQTVVRFAPPHVTIAVADQDQSFHGKELSTTPGQEPQCIVTKALQVPGGGRAERPEPPPRVAAGRRGELVVFVQKSDGIGRFAGGGKKARRILRDLGKTAQLPPEPRQKIALPPADPIKVGA